MRYRTHRSYDTAYKLSHFLLPRPYAEVLSGYESEVQWAPGCHARRRGTWSGSRTGAGSKPRTRRGSTSTWPAAHVSAASPTRAPSRSLKKNGSKIIMLKNAKIWPITSRKRSNKVYFSQCWKKGLFSHGILITMMIQRWNVEALQGPDKFEK